MCAPSTSDAGTGTSLRIRNGTSIRIGCCLQMIDPKGTLGEAGVGWSSELECLAISMQWNDEIRFVALLVSHASECMGYSLNCIAGVEGGHHVTWVFVLAFSSIRINPPTQAEVRAIIALCAKLSSGASGGSGGLRGTLVHASEREAEQTSPSQLHFARDQRHDVGRVLTIPLNVLGGLWEPGASGGDWITKKFDSSTNLKSAYHLIVGRF